MSYPVHEIKVGSILGIRGWETINFSANVMTGERHSREIGLYSGLNALRDMKWWYPGGTHIAKPCKRVVHCVSCPGTEAPCILTDLPGITIRCGIHATRTVKLYHERNNIYSSDEAIIGVIEMFGRVVECEYGWRAEKARVAMLSTRHRYSAAIAKLYDVPRVPPCDLDHIIEEANSK